MRKKIIWGMLLLFTLWIPAKAQTWDQVIKKVASDRAASDNFGYSVAIDGDYAIVGAPYEDEDENGNNNAPDAGSAYILKRISGTWTQLQKIVASDRASNDQFGFSVAISGNHIAIGAPLEDEDVSGANTSSSAGSAYVFEQDQYGVWNESQKIVASDRAIDDYFAISIAISGDIILAGAYLESQDENGSNTLEWSGSAYIFEIDGNGDCNEIQKIVASDRSISDYFGISVSIDNDYILIGAFGEDHDVSGANALNSSGSAYIFEFNGMTWNEVQKITALDRGAYDLFGNTVAISGDHAIVGAWNEDEDENGSNTLSNSGSAYIFARDQYGVWSQSQKIVASDRATNDEFARSVSISGDFAIVAASKEDQDENGSNTLSNSGSAYVYEIDGNGDWNEVQKVVASTRGNNDLFGWKVAISNNYFIVGSIADGEDENESNTVYSAGSSYIFEYCTPPSVTLTLNTDIACVGITSPFALSGGSPAGGTYSGTGVSSGNFDPSVAGVGTHTITYTYTNANGCFASATDNIIVGSGTLSAGPGGVGSSTDNELWLDASYLTLSNSTAISTGASAWLDRSGNGNDASQSTSAKQPVFYTNQINGLPAVDFDGTSDYVSTGAISDLNTDNLTWIVVGEADVFQIGNLMSSNYTSGAGSNSDYLWRTYTSSTQYGGMSRTSTGTQKAFAMGSNSGYQILTSVWDGNTDLIKGYTNEGTYTGNNSVDASPSGHVRTRLGASPNASADFFDGRIAEAIIYSKKLNEAERIIVDNYLAAKYNITLAGNDIFAYDPTHSVEAAGIGQGSDGTNHSSAKGGNVEMKTPSSLANGDYLMWAHDNGSLTANTTDVPSAYTSTSGERLPREWRADKTNDVGTVTVSFYLDGIAIDSDLELLVDSDGTFSNATRITSGYSYDPGCDIATWTGVNFTDGDYFTIGSPDGTALFQTPITEFENSDTEENSSENTLEVINNFNQQVEMKLYPNPTSGILKIENKIENASISVFNTVGQLVYTGQINTGINSIDFSNLYNGIYFIEVNDINKNSVLKTQFVILK